MSAQEPASAAPPLVSSDPVQPHRWSPPMEPEFGFLGCDPYPLPFAVWVLGRLVCGWLGGYLLGSGARGTDKVSLPYFLNSQAWGHVGMGLPELAFVTMVM